ncbi:glycosyltransferase family 2 protein [bacterium]|nr:MAG: glycosyltransferase family 2 protein [bacterium]
MAPSVSIVLPVWNGARDLRDTLPALAAQQYDGKVEIIAIDSGSRDDSVDLLREAGARIWEIPQSEFGHGKTRNFGVREASGEIIVFLSQDATPMGSDWLQQLVKPVQDSHVGAAFARQLPRQDATPLERYFHYSIYPAKGSITRSRKGRALSVSNVFFSNVCSVARREVCLRFPFDETVIMSEDQVFSRDLLQNGLDIVYAPQAQVIHSHHYNLRALFKRNFDSGYSLRSFPGDPMWKQMGKAIMFITREVRFLAREKQFAWLLYLPIYEAVRFAALISGTQAERLPHRTRVALSLHSSYWNRESQDKT